jgi:chemotaxis family two-component system response regulator Rcp1
MTVLSAQHTILIVEDNAADAALVADALQDSPSAPRLLTSSGGRAALELLRSGVEPAPPDVVLLDLNLPGFSGLETLAELKSDPVLRRIPVVVLTTSKSQHEIDRCYELGAAAVLNKPMRLRDYREMISAFERFWFGHVRLPDRG